MKVDKSTKRVLAAVPVIGGVLVLLAGIMIANSIVMLSSLLLIVVCPILYLLLIREKEKDDLEKVTVAQSAK